MSRPRSTITELIGGPLDGQEVDLDVTIDDPTLDYIDFACIDEDRVTVLFTARYRVMVWRKRRLALVFDASDIFDE
jgi:hypothetical protein